MTQKTNRLVVGRRAALVLTWGLTVVVAAGLGWLAGRLSVTADDSAWVTGQFRSEGDTPWASFESPLEDPLLEPDADAPTTDEAAPAAEPTAEISTPLPEVTPPPVVTQAPPLPVPVPVEPVELPEVVATVEPISDLIDRADRLAEGGDRDGARIEAEALLGEYIDYTGLTSALVADGAGEVSARLDALRVLQLAGLEEISTELARELKRSYASTAEVLQAIDDWRILKPRITSLETSIEKGERVVVTGDLENPDIGTVRRVLVEVEALDAAGNVLATQQIRVKPKAIDPGAVGSFTLRFTSIDPSFVVRTRATVVKWQSEVLDSG